MLLFSRFLLVLIDFKQNFGPYPPGSSGIDTAMGKTCPGKLCVTNKMRHPILTSGASCLCDNVFSLGGYSKVGHRILKFLSHDIQIVECDADIRSAELFFIVFLNRVHKSARVCHLHGENLPQHRRLSATSPAPLPPKSSAGNPTDRARRY